MKAHVTEILRKLKLFSRNKAIIELGKIPLPVAEACSGAKAEKGALCVLHCEANGPAYRLPVGFEITSCGQCAVISDPREDGAALTTTVPLVDDPPLGKVGVPRLLIVEDHPLFRAALIGVIGAEFPDAEVLQATSIDGALDVIASRDGLDLILLDLSMPGTTRPARRLSGCAPPRRAARW